ncbi:MAG: aminoglycoside phosphotransferase family protein [Dehalococcoidia bacterium]|nr:aminoglycoside phosphotransferase family protein [Dehalococcoidia bacterium]
MSDAPRPRLHPDEIDVDADLVRRLLGGQFPQWAALPLEVFESSGTSNWIVRLGDDMAVRLPRRPSSVASLAMEFAWLPRLAPRLSVPVPVPLARGAPTEEFPYAWYVYPWLAGTGGTIEATADATDLAHDVAGFVRELQHLEASGGPTPNSGRGLPLARRDARTRECIAELDALGGGLIDAGAAIRAWEASLGAPVWEGPPAWLHGDLLPTNLLLADGRLSGVIDFGSLGIGDPACDLMVAWTNCSDAARAAFRAELDHDAATWLRARGWALSWAVIALPYYLRTNPEFVATARHTIRAVLADAEA